MSTACQANTMACPSEPIVGPTQLCASAAECMVKGDVCAPLSIPGVMLPAGLMINSCQAAGDGGSSSGGGDAATTDSGSSSGAGDAATDSGSSSGGDAGDGG